MHCCNVKKKKRKKFRENGRVDHLWRLFVQCSLLSKPLSMNRSVKWQDGKKSTYLISKISYSIRLVAKPALQDRKSCRNVLCMFGCPPYVWTPAICLDAPCMFNAPIFLDAPHMFGCPSVCLDAPICLDIPLCLDIPYVWMSPICLDTCHMFGCPPVCLDSPVVWCPIYLDAHLYVWIPPYVWTPHILDAPFMYTPICLDSPHMLNALLDAPIYTTQRKHALSD